MPPFRKGGSFVRFSVEGDVPPPGDDAFYVALAEQRFRSIENAASEETSAGWVSPGDPSGQDFVRDEIWLDSVARLRMRIDRKRLPPAWLSIYLLAELRARGDRPVSARERKEIKADIEDKLLPRLLPTVQFVDVVYVPASRTVLLFATSGNVMAECGKLFFRTFGAQLVAAEPTNLAMRSGLGDERLRALEQIAPFTLKAEPAALREAHA